MNTFTRITGIALAAVLLVFCGCSDEPEKDKPIDPRLTGEWSNELEGADGKTFSIDYYGYFTASLDPAGADGRGTVTGKLTAEGTEYIMSNMKETTGKNWGDAVRFYNGTYIQIIYDDARNSFELQCKDSPPVKEFFGGVYKKQ